MGKFFDPERGLWSLLSTLVDICGLSLLWALLCLPVVTIGPATAALYYAVVKAVRRKDREAFHAFFHSFRQNLRTGIPATLLWAAALALFLSGCMIMYANRGTQWGYILYVAYYVAMALPLGVLCYVFPLLARFTCGVGGLYRTAFQLALRHLPSTVVVVALTVKMTELTINHWWPVLFTPAVTALISSLFLERIFVKYAPELAETEPNGEPEEDQREEE